MSHVKTAVMPRDTFGRSCDHPEDRTELISVTLEVYHRGGASPNALPHTAVRAVAECTIRHACPFPPAGAQSVLRREDCYLGRGGVPVFTRLLKGSSA